MYIVKICPQISAYEIEELVKMFLPKDRFEIMVDEALDINQSFCLVFENKVISDGLNQSFYKNHHPSNNKEYRNAVKQGIYTALSAHTSKNLPWGILTGVKPVKIVRELWERGMSKAGIFEYMQGYYFLNEDKVDLLLRTLDSQYKLSCMKDEKAVGIYLGIPFCPTRCVYCSFTANVVKDDEITRYLEALYREIEYTAAQMNNNNMYPESFYIGGGTPTTLNENQLDALLTEIFSCFDMSKCMEFTVEAGRPDTITEDKLLVLRKHGVERISINPQSMNDKTLRNIGRLHSADKIEEAYFLARKSGIKIINMDIIAGLPDESPEDFKYTLDKVVEMEPENITVHTLALKRASKLKEEDEKFNYKAVERLETMINLSSESMKENGYKPYYLYRQKYMVGNLENVGYAKPGTECIYNIKTMDERQTMVALGAGGISKRYFSEENRIERAANVSNYDIYIERIEEMLERKNQLLFANRL